ncbi:hypothetical protein ACFOWM_08830 [Ferruginibacter yonginensis]|uniref:Lipocalin-like domain-containing protein n=1 Tax=Ferruginibacter yonginensis TaxID=1310416 RepID=A0ABV8QVK3_9BACT
MKSILLTVISFCVISLSSCKKDDNSTNITTSAVTATVVTGNWRITYYYDTDHEETNNYSGYSFVFANNNTVTATKTGTTAINGTWNTALDDSKTKLVLSFSSPASFVEISDDWHVIERTDTKIRLQDVSGGNGGVDFLTFERN